MLTEKYKAAVDQLRATASGVDVREEGGKLYLKGQTPYQVEANHVWDTIKAVSTWPDEVVADIQALNKDAYGFYTVQSGDTLSKIAKHFLGDANKYPAIFDVNRDQLSDPNKIGVGQKLKLPWPA
jgi:nucleoid-associated protein YgaU